MNVHLFGLPISLHRRLKEESGGKWAGAVPNGHAFVATPLNSNEIRAFSTAELGELDKAVGNGLTHIVIPASRDWREIGRRFQYDCRIHIARLRQPLRDLTWAILRDTLHAIVIMDETWLDKLSPKDLRHALLLPPECFLTNARTVEYWRRCDVYSMDQFASAERLLNEVEREHRTPDRQGGHSWLDARNRRFRPDPSRHGRSSADRDNRKSYRFCYEIPAGFHYDVTEDSGRSFKINIGSKTETVTHCNITPWGFIRLG